MTAIRSLWVSSLCLAGYLLGSLVAATGQEPLPDCQRLCNSFGMVVVPGSEVAVEYTPGIALIAFRIDSSGISPNGDNGPLSFRTWSIGTNHCKQFQQLGMGGGNGTHGDWTNANGDRQCTNE